MERDARNAASLDKRRYERQSVMQKSISNCLNYTILWQYSIIMSRSTWSNDSSLLLPNERWCLDLRRHHDEWIWLLIQITNARFLIGLRMSSMWEIRFLKSLMREEMSERKTKYSNYFQINFLISRNIKNRFTLSYRLVWSLPVLVSTDVVDIFSFVSCSYTKMTH